MNDLRTALIVLGVVFLAALALWERRRASRRSRATSLSDSATAPTAPRAWRVEPSIGDFPASPQADAGRLEVPSMHPVDSLRVDIMKEAAVDVPVAARRTGETGQMPALSAESFPEAPAAGAGEESDAAPAAAGIIWPPPHTEKVLSLRVVRADAGSISGRALRQALESAGMVHGPQRIYHLVDAQGAVRASAANLVRPGSLDPALMDTQEFHGLSVFSILPGPLPPSRMLDGLVRLARGIAARLGAVVQDDQGALLDADRLTRLRQSVLGQAEAARGGEP